VTVLTRKGYTGRNLGRACYLEAPPEWRATTVQACGLYPFAIGSGSPPIGTPLGQHLSTGQAVCLAAYVAFRRLLHPDGVDHLVLGRVSVVERSLGRMIGGCRGLLFSLTRRGLGSSRCCHR